MELIIKGDANKLTSLEKELRLRAKRNGFTMVLKTKDVKNIKVVAEEVKPEVKAEVKTPKAKTNKK